MTNETLQPVASGRERRWRRDNLLRSLGYENYAEYIGSPQWSAVRRRYYAEREYKCALCPTAESLVLHHRTYDRVGGEELDDLIPLCPPCHGFVHGLERDGYILTLDPEAVEKLADAQRAKRNRIEQRRRRIAAQPEMTEELWRREVRSVTERFRQAAIRAYRRKVDVSEEVGMINDAIAALQRKVGI